MPNLASVLKDEIRRLAKKEAKVQMASLRAASVRARKDIASLKRENRELERRVVGLQKRLGKGAVAGAGAAAPAKEETQVRFSPDWVLNHREKLDLSAADYATLVGVSPLTIYNWEKGKSRPQKRQLAAWGAIKKLGKREAWRILEEQEGR